MKDRTTTNRVESEANITRKHCMFHLIVENSYLKDLQDKEVNISVTLCIVEATVY